MERLKRFKDFRLSAPSLTAAIILLFNEMRLMLVFANWTTKILASHARTSEESSGNRISQGRILIAVALQPTYPNNPLQKVEFDEFDSDAFPQPHGIKVVDDTLNLHNVKAICNGTTDYKKRQRSLKTSVSCLRLSEVRIPNHIFRGNSARLECIFELDEGESLYSVKWYKDGNEFFRYHPKDSPPAKVLSLPGVIVDLENSTDTLVTLKSVPLAATGRYRCEVLGEAPAFHTVAEHGDMTVIALPVEGPKITGGLRRYHPGDTARLWCASGPSSPPAGLAWLLNGQPAPASALRGPRMAPSPPGLTTTMLGLEFKVRPEHFKKGDLKLKCIATVATVYWRSNEESVEGEKPQRAPALESRDSAAGPDSRAHRVQATTLSSASCCHLGSSTLTAFLIFLHKTLTDR